MAACRVYWGSHGCDLPRGHDGPHWCECAPEAARQRGYITKAERDRDGSVGGPPYYGPDTQFYGEDSEEGDPLAMAESHLRKARRLSRLAMVLAVLAVCLQILRLFI